MPTDSAMSVLLSIMEWFKIMKTFNIHQTSLRRLIWCGAMLLSQVLFAQKMSSKSSQVKELKAFSEEVQNRSLDKLQLARISQEKNWAIRQTQSNGREIVLQGIDERGNPIYYATHNAILASQTTKTASLYAGGGLGLNLNGSSSSVANKMGLWDSGRALITHQEFTNRVRIIEGANYYSDHSTHLAGILTATGINASARGMAWGANLKVWDFTNDIFEMSLAAPDLLISNHSYGVLSGWVYNPDRPGTDDNLKWEWWGDESVSITDDYKFGFYDSKARDLDKIANLAPYYLIVKSADNKRGETGPPPGTRHYLRNTTQTSTVRRSPNDAYDNIPTEATAKNILTVGAVDGVSKAIINPSDIIMTSFSSWGPTDDGRIKPDLVGMGVDITSSIATSTKSYSAYTGTSVASPNVAGTLLLLQEYYAQINKGNFMRASTIKALAIHTANEAGTSAGPDYQYGWGLLNAEKAAKAIGNQTNNLITEKTLSQGGTQSISVVAKGGEPLIITIAWNDPEATPFTSNMLNNRTPKLVNDLDIRVSDGIYTSFPWVLDPANPTRPAIVGDNIRDNVEQVIINSPTPGKTYQVAISHKGSLKDGSQAFSLIASGINQVSCQMSIGINPNTTQTLCQGVFVRFVASTGTNYTYQWYKDNLAIIGATTYQYYATQAGAYHVKVSQGSCQASSQQVVVQSSTLKASISASGNTNICNGTSVTLNSNSGTNYAYQWLRNGTSITGATNASYTVTQTGSYTIKIRDANTNCTISSSALQVNANAITASISPSGSVTVCQQSSVTLSASSGSGYAYQWFRNGNAISGATLSYYVATSSGNYTVQITSGGCTVSSESTSVSIGSITPSIHADNTNLCNGTVMLLTDTGSGYTYQWYKDGIAIANARSFVYSVTQTGNYSVRVSDASGCSGISSTLVVTGGGSQANVNIIAQSSTIFFAGNSVVLEATNIGNNPVQWVKDGYPLTGAISTTYKATQSGVYSVRVGTGTCASFSNSLSVIVLNVIGSNTTTNAIDIPQKQNARLSSFEISDPVLSIYPNPTTNNIVQVEYHTSDPIQEATVTLLSNMGTPILTLPLKKESIGLFKQTLYLDKLPVGKHFIQVQGREEVITKPVVKQ
jgi:Subtilase family